MSKKPKFTGVVFEGGLGRFIQKIGLLVKISIFVCSLPPCRVSREFYFPKMCSMTEKIVVINRGP